MKREPQRDHAVSGQHKDAAASRRTIQEYLDGSDRAFDVVDRWVRTELQVRFPVLQTESEDLRQTVHSNLLLTFRRGTFRYQSSLRTFVVRITRYIAVDHIRKAYRDPLWESVLESQLNLTPDSPYRSLDSLEKGQLLREILLLSSRDCRELWRLVFIDQLGYEEIGRRLSISPGTVKSRMWRCRQRAMMLLKKLPVRTTRRDH